MTSALSQLTTALMKWPLDREQRSFIQEAIAGIDEDRATALLELDREAESALISCSNFLKLDENRKENAEVDAKAQTGPRMKFRPLHDRVVVRRIESEEKSAGGIIIPDTAKEKPSQGEVIAVGPGGRDEAGKLIPIDIKVGDRVLFGKWSGTEVKIDGQELLIMKESDIMGILPEEEAWRKIA
jgi:chaperonin GroES